MATDGISGVSRFKSSPEYKAGVPAQSLFVGSHRLKDRKVQYTTCDLFDLVAVGIYTIISASVERPPILQQLRYALRISSQRPGGVAHKSTVDPLERTIEPDCNPVILYQLPIARLKKGAAAERDDIGVTGLNLADFFPDRFGFKSSKRRLALPSKDLSDARLLFGFDLNIEIRESPPQFGSKRRSYGALTGCHKAHEEESGCPL
jgi:hypothetical protein